jgi:hypothetical protein
MRYLEILGSASSAMYYFGKYGQQFAGRKCRPARTEVTAALIWKSCFGDKSVFTYVA